MHTGELTEDRVLTHLNALLLPVRQLKVQKSDSKFADRAGNTDVLVVFERFLLGHVANMQMQNTDHWTGTRRWDTEIAALYASTDVCGLTRIVLRCCDDDLGRRILATRAHRNEAWSAFLNTTGDDDQVVAHYRMWQSHLLALADQHREAIKPVFVDIKAGDDLARLRALGDDIYRDFIAEKS